MNFVEIGEQLQSYPKEQLLAMAQGQLQTEFPQFTILAEIQRRTQMEQAYAAQAARQNDPDQTVYEKTVNEFANSGLAQGQSPEEAMMPEEGGSPMQQMAMDQSGEEMPPQGMMSGMPLAEEMPSEGLMQRIPMALGGRVGYREGRDIGISGGGQFNNPYQPVSQMSSYQASLPYEEDDALDFLSEQNREAYDYFQAVVSGEEEGDQNVAVQMLGDMHRAYGPDLGKQTEEYLVDERGMSAPVASGLVITAQLGGGGPKGKLKAITNIGKKIKETIKSAPFRRWLGRRRVRSGKADAYRMVEKDVLSKSGASTSKKMIRQGLRPYKEIGGEYLKKVGKWIGGLTTLATVTAGGTQLAKNKKLAEAIAANPKIGETKVEDGKAWIFTEDGWMTQAHYDKKYPNVPAPVTPPVVPPVARQITKPSYAEALAQAEKQYDPVTASITDYPTGKETVDGVGLSTLALTSGVEVSDFTEEQQRIRAMGLSSLVLEGQTAEERKAEIESTGLALMAKAFGGAKNLGEAAEIIGEGIPKIADIKRLHRREANEMKAIERQAEAEDNSLELSKASALANYENINFQQQMAQEESIVNRKRINNEVTMLHINLLAGRADYNLNIEKSILDRNYQVTNAARALVEAEYTYETLLQNRDKLDISQINSLTDVILMYQASVDDIVLSTMDSRGVTPEEAKREIDELKKRQIIPLQNRLQLLLGGEPRTQAAPTDVQALGAANITATSP